MTAREQALVALLERYDDLVDPQQIRGGGDRDSFGALMPGTYSDSVRELERLLRAMRDSHRAPIIKWEAGGKRYAASPRKLWWHLNARYIACPLVVRELPVRRRAKHGKTVTVLERTVVRGANGADDVLVARGVSWLADGWALVHEPMLPRAEIDREPVAA